MNKQEYNEVPVHYCKHCLSLYILDDEGYSMCGKCGGSLTGKASIEVWELMHEEWKGFNFLTGKSR